MRIPIGLLGRRMSRTRTSKTWNNVGVKVIFLCKTMDEKERSNEDAAKSCTEKRTSGDAKAARRAL